MSTHDNWLDDLLHVEERTGGTGIIYTNPADLITSYRNRIKTLEEVTGSND